MMEKDEEELGDQKTSIDQELPRYLRAVQPWKRREVVQKVLQDAKSLTLQSSIDYLEAIKWLPSFLAIPGELSLNTLKEKCLIDYKVHGFFPMDISSALAVLALNLPSAEKIKVLDLCCSPGAKLLMMSELISRDSTLVGVDISERRLQTCQSLLEQWQMNFYEEEEIRPQYLFHCDGVKFSATNLGSLVFASDILKSEFQRNKSRKRKNKSYRKRLQESLKQIQQRLEAAQDPNQQSLLDQSLPVPPSFSSFDFILVDAECTHDASYRHMKYVEQGTKWVKTQPSSSVHSTTSNHDRKRQKVKRSREGYFEIEKETVNEEEAEEEEERDFWEEEYTAEDVQRFIERDQQQFPPNHIHSEEQLPTLPSAPEKEEEEVVVPQKTLTLTHNIRDVKVSSEGKLALRDLQRSLLENAFQLVRPGGVVVYSTCSQEEDQNEEIVQWLLDRHHPKARLDSLPVIFQSFAEVVKETEIASSLPLDPVAMLQREKALLLEGHLPGTIRVNDKIGMSEHFIARIQKLP